MFILVWHDYDSNEIERFDKKVNAENRIAELLASEDEDYGFSLDALIEGKDVEYKIVNVVNKVKII